MRSLSSLLAASLALAALSLSSVGVHAQITAPPNTLNFQGRLATPSGNPVPNGTYSVRFRFYDAATGGAVLYEKTLASVAVKNGTFAVQIDGFTADKFNGNTWLAIKVGADTELAPRTQIVSVPYALKSTLALTVPDGSITNAKIAAGSITADKFASGTLNGTAWLLGGNSGTNSASHFLGTTDAQPLLFKTNNIERMRILSDGNVGIGTVNPVAPLHISGNIRATGKALIGVSSALDDPGNYLEALVVDGAARTFGDLRVDTNARVGGNTRVVGKTFIGANYTLNLFTNYGESLVVDGGARTFGTLRVDTNARVVGKTFIGANASLDNPDGYIEALVVDGAARTFGNLLVDTNARVGGNIRTTGKALIGASSALDTPGNYLEALVVDGGARTFGNLLVDTNARVVGTARAGSLNIDTNARVIGKTLIGASTSFDNPGNYLEALVVDGSARTFGSLLVDTSLSVGSTLSVGNMPFGDYRNVQWNNVSGQLYYDNSSRKHKRNITPLVDDFDLLLKAQPVTYTRPNAPGRWEIGFIAEDFDAIGLKKLVDYGQNGEVEGINYEKISLYLTQIAKRQQQTIEQQGQLLRNQGVALENQRKEIDQLKAQMEKAMQMLERERR